jgi:hypothetical protein
MVPPATSHQHTEINTRSVEFFDPPMCCPTGLCGPVLDQTLLDVNEMILTLQTMGITVTRYQMASDPNAFLNQPGVMKLIKEKQLAALPVTLVNGNLIKSGAYPTISEVEMAIKEEISI